MTRAEEGEAASRWGCEIRTGTPSNRVMLPFTQRRTGLHVTRIPTKPKATYWRGPASFRCASQRQNPTDDVPDLVSRMSGFGVDCRYTGCFNGPRYRGVEVNAGLWCVDGNYEAVRSGSVVAGQRRPASPPTRCRIYRDKSTVGQLRCSARPYILMQGATMSALCSQQPVGV